MNFAWKPKPIDVALFVQKRCSLCTSKKRFSFEAPQEIECGKTIVNAQSLQVVKLGRAATQRLLSVDKSQ